MFSIVVEVRVRPRFFDQVGHEISIFSQNHVSLPKLWTTSSNISKSVLSKSFFSVENGLNHSIFSVTGKEMHTPTFFRYIHGFMSNLIKKPWTDSNYGASNAISLLQCHISSKRIRSKYIVLIFFFKNENTNYHIFEEVVHNFGKSDDDMM